MPHTQPNTAAAEATHHAGRRKANQGWTGTPIFLLAKGRREPGSVWGMVELETKNGRKWRVTCVEPCGWCDFFGGEALRCTDRNLRVAPIAPFRSHQRGRSWLGCGLFVWHMHSNFRPSFGSVFCWAFGMKSSRMWAQGTWMGLVLDSNWWSLP